MNLMGKTRVSGATVNDNAVYGGKVITDLTITNNLSENLSIAIGANNLFDVYPDDNRPGSQGDGSFPFSRRTSQFGYTGTFLFARLSFTIN